jgi:membrane protein DedA with SNARE-associated domain
MFVFLSLLFPGTAVLIASGTLISEGILDPLPTVTAGILGAVLGDSVSFWLGKKFGTVFQKHGPSEDILRASRAALAFSSAMAGAASSSGDSSALCARLSHWRLA